MDWTDQDIERITNKLIAEDREGITVERLPSAFKSTQLLYDVKNFIYSTDWQTTQWNKVLCIDVNKDNWSPIPIAINSLYENIWFKYDFPFRRLTYRYAELLLSEMGIPVYSANSKSVKEYFKSNFKRFISTRLLGIIDDTGNNKATSGDVLFTVNTQNDSLRVLFSPAYLFGSGTVFGYPSTPVSSFLSPGSYIFGAEGVGISPVWEATRIYHVPNQTNATMLAI